MTTAADPPLIHVTAEAWTQLPPSAAVLHVTLTADRLFSGRAALDKAAELRRLVSALAERDIPESAVSLAGASLDVSSGLFARSSSVTYRARVRLVDLERLADALDAVAACKQAQLSHVAWEYGRGDDALLGECAGRARARAAALAAALGVTITAVQRVDTEELGGETAAEAVLLAGTARTRASIASELAGLDLAPPKSVGVRVRLAYAIG